MQTSAGRAAAENWLMEAVKFYFALKIVATALFFCPLNGVWSREGTVPSMWLFKHLQLHALCSKNYWSAQDPDTALQISPDDI